MVNPYKVSPKSKIHFRRTQLFNLFFHIHLYRFPEYAHACRHYSYANSWIVEIRSIPFITLTFLKQLNVLLTIRIMKKNLLSERMEANLGRCCVEGCRRIDVRSGQTRNQLQLRIQSECSDSFPARVLQYCSKMSSLWIARLKITIK